MFLAYQKIFSSLGWNAVSIVRPNALLANLLGSSVVYLNYNRIVPLTLQPAAIGRARSIIAVEIPDFIVLHKGVDAFFWSTASPSAFIVLIVHGFYTKHLKYAKQLIAVSNAVLIYLKKKGYNAVLILNFLDECVDRHDIIQNDIVKIGSFGCFRRTKGFTDLIKAFAIIKKEHPLLNFSAHLWGKGQLKYIYHVMRLIYNVKNFFIHDWAHNAREVMKELDVVIIPSRSETFGMVAIEAFASGAWVISTNTLGAIDVINMCGGTLVPCNSPKDLAKAIYDVISNFSSYAEKRYQARDNVSKFYSIERATRDVFRVFCEFKRNKD